MEVSTQDAKVVKKKNLRWNEISLLLQEITYFEDVLEDLKFYTIGDPSKSYQVAKFVIDTRQFNRILNRLQSELSHNTQELEKENCSVSKLEKDDQYLSSEMADLQNSYSEYKHRLKSFVTTFNHLAAETA